MRRILRTVWVFGLLSAPCDAVVAQDNFPRVAPAEVGLSGERLERVTSLLNRFVDDEKIAGAVAGVARHGRLAYLEAVGYQNLQTQTAMTEASLFRIYSMTKAVTAVAVMMFEEEGRFELDDPVAMYLPDFDRVMVAESQSDPGRPPQRPVTVRDLLLHTSGLSHRGSELYQDLGVRSRSIPMSRFIQNIVAAPLMEDPGTQFRYSAATTVLGGLVEVWSGQPLDEFLRDRLLVPLGMMDTSFWVEADRVDRLTTVYRGSDGGGVVPYQIEDVPFTEKPTLLEGAVGLVSTVSDFMKFSQMLLNGGELGEARILREATVAEITSNGLSPAILEARRGSMGWGLANVNVMLDPSSVGYPSSPGEYGWDGSAGTIFWVDPAEELVTVLMWQNSPANPDSLRQQVKALVHDAIVR